LPDRLVFTVTLTLVRVGVAQVGVAVTRPVSRLIVAASVDCVPLTVVPEEPTSATACTTCPVGAVAVKFSFAFTG
jgi:hypothetical protein